MAAKKSQNINLLGSTSRIEVPFIKVTIGNYTFGVKDRVLSREKDDKDFYMAAKITYPNYIQSLDITKINGQVNTYKLQFKYPIRPGDDPNFFEKVFSSVSSTRKILFSYGDASMPSFAYKEEQCIITNVTTQFDIVSSVITYNVEAVSSAALAISGSFTFTNNTGLKKPSEEIKRILYTSSYGLLDLFYGMGNKELVESKGLIRGDDAPVQLETKTNCSSLDYLTYLVRCMTPSAESTDTLKKKDFYSLSIIDDTTGEFGGPYFKITRVSKVTENMGAYDIDIGYPTANIVTSFSINNNENYSIYYNYQEKLSNSDYVKRLDDNGGWEEVFAPTISSKNEEHETRISDSMWWTKVTEYPISATITIKGLLRPAILMSYVKLRVLFFGQEHITSGLYIVTKQQDRIDSSGYRTTLTLTRIGAAESK